MQGCKVRLKCRGSVPGKTGALYGPLHMRDVGHFKSEAVVMIVDGIGTPNVI